jgi:hypothetical protein
MWLMPADDYVKFVVAAAAAAVDSGKRGVVERDAGSRDVSRSTNC